MRRLSACLALLVLVACGGGDSATNPNSDSLAGVYSLQTINGTPLPFTVQSGATVGQIVSDVITMADGGTWSEAFAVQITATGSTTHQTGANGGTWVRVGSGVSLISDGGGVAWTGSFTGSALELTDGDFAYRFVR